MPVTILCLQHDPEQMELHRSMLADEGYEVIVVTSGEKLLKILSTAHCSCVITDYCTPELRGGLLAVQIARSYPRVPIVLLCSSLDAVPLELRNFVSACIESTGSAEVLVEQIETIVRTAQLSAPSLKWVV